MNQLQIRYLWKILISVASVFILGQISLFMFCSCKCDSMMTMAERNDLIMTRVGERRSQRSLTNQEKNNEYMAQIVKLNLKIEELQKQISKYQLLDKYIINEEINGGKQNSRIQLESADLLNSYRPHNEHEVIPFTSFTFRHLYGEIGFLSKRPKASPIGQQAVELREVLKYALSDLNRDVESSSEHITIDQFVEGITRNDFTQGTVYDLYFRSTNSNNVFKRMKLFRPFSNLKRIGKPETIDTRNELINIIIPLSGRIEKFRAFMDRLVDVGIRRDRRIFITLVYFGYENRQKIKDYFLKMEKDEGFEDYMVIFTSEEFNRGIGLQKGVKSWKKGNVLMFFCDIDIYFENDFLERCRLHTSPGSKVYYPIVFSQYNPSIIYGGRPPPPLEEQMRVMPESGFWRDFGFGMTCQYRDDFLKVGGFDPTIKGWGGEDIALYKQYLSNINPLTIVRAYDPGLIHIYHEKNCRKTLSDSQFISCLQSKAIAEGSHKQLGMLAFGNSLVNGVDPDWANRLRSSLNQIVSEEKIEEQQMPKNVT